jgi:hypothetical protein
VREEIKTVREEIKLAEARLQGEIKTVREEIKTMEAKIDTRFEKQQRMFLIMFLSLLFATLFTNKETLVFFLKIVGVVK